MENKVLKIIPKKYAKNIESCYKDSDGYWAYAKNGYHFKSTECGTAHGETQQEFLRDIRSLTKED